ncbi:MAG: hypothetical protein L0241_11755, partial [Planctomycetia bacterium]|nr:hypothetical protein [Planctomycetia bacterium]
SPQKSKSPEGKSEPTRKLGLSSEVASRVVLSDIRLVRSMLRQDVDDEKSPARIELKFGAESRVQDDDDEQSLRIVVDVHFSISGKTVDSEREALRIDTALRLTYTLSSNDGLTDEHIAAFGELNGVYNAWPFLREYVQSTTIRMGLPPLTLPLFNPQQKQPFGSEQPK